MNFKDRLTISKELFNESLKLLYSKGKAYASDSDSLANFKRNAERLSLTKYQIWGVYFNKHIDAINNAIGRSPTRPVDESEGLRGRILDAITCLFILQCLLTEDALTPHFDHTKISKLLKDMSVKNRHCIKG